MAPTPCARLRAGLFFVSTVSLGLAVLLSSPSVIPILAAAPDYSAGVQRLLALGVPDVSKARYVKVEWEGAGAWMYRQTVEMEGEELEGGVWLLETQADGSASMLLNLLETRRVLTPEALKNIQAERMEKMRSAQGQDPESMVALMQMEETLAGTWTEADLKKDLATVLAYLRKPDTSLDLDYEAEEASKFFLFGALALQQGHKEEANALLARLFEITGDSRRILSAAMNQMATLQYTQAHQDFSKSGNWKDYLEAMKGILQRFPGVWQDEPVVRMIADQVRQRIATPQPPPLKGPDISPEDQELATALGRSEQGVRRNLLGASGGLWVIPPSKEAAAQTGTAPDPLQQIQQRGLQSIPLLIHLLEDSYLVRSKAGSDRNSMHFSTSANVLGPEEIQARYQRIARPVTRGEIAQDLLMPLIQKGEEEMGFQMAGLVTPDPTEIARLAREWYTAHQDQSPGELLRFFLAEGSQPQRQMAIQRLLQSKHEADRSAVETFLLKPENIPNHVHTVNGYARQQGPKAADFVKQFLLAAGKLESLIPAERSEHMQPKMKERYEKQLRTQLKSLEQLVSDQSPAELLGEVLASQDSWTRENLQSALAGFWSKVGQLKLGEQLTLLLPGIASTKEGLVAENLMQGAMGMAMQRGSGIAALQGGGESGTPEPLPKLAEHASLWKPLLKDRRSFGGGWAATLPDSGSFTIAHGAAMTMETLYSDADPSEMFEGLEPVALLGNRFYDIFIARAQARLEGRPEKELPAFPDPARVTPERHQAMVEALAAPQTDFGTFITGLTLDETLALPGLLEEHEELAVKLRPIANRVRSVEVGEGFGALAVFCKKLSGEPFNRKHADELVAAAQAQLKKGKTFQITLTRTVPLAGLKLTLKEVETDADSPYSYMFGNMASEFPGSGSLMALLMAANGDDGIYENAMWIVSLDPVKKPDPAAAKTQPAPDADSDLLSPDVADPSAFSGDYLKEQQATFFEALETIWGPDFNPAQGYTLTLTGALPKTE